MPPPKHPTRGQQRATGGLGEVFISPVKRHAPPEKRKLVIPMGHESKRQRLQEKLLAMQNAASNPQTAQPPIISSQNAEFAEGAQPDFDLHQEARNTIENVSPPLPPLRRILPDNAAHNLYDKWKLVLPGLIDALLTFLTESTGKVMPTPTSLQTTCQTPGCTKKSNQILCLFQDHFQKIIAISCRCQDILTVLVTNGLFPTAPTSPRMAISILLLDFYNALFEKACDAINALASALSTFYKRRGFVPLNDKGEPMSDGFRRGLGYAVQWYDNLRTLLTKRVDEVVISAGALVEDLEDRTNLHLEGLGPLPEGIHTSERSSSSKVQCDSSRGEGPPGLKRGWCARVLVQRCPACFGGNWFGRPLDQGADIHTSVDGNFNHRHLISAGDCPPFYEPEYFLTKEQVDVIGSRIEGLRKKPPQPRIPKVPDEAVDDCESSHVAGSGANSKTNMDKFDNGGIMALVCRHDIPLFLTNIDTPGEQQKYAVALIEHLYTLLPPDATVNVLYDVGCVLDRSLQLYPFLSTDITNRLSFATSAMHAYAHQWSCQLVYNPRIRVGLGLSDGEGVERLWSRCRKLIGITRMCARARRIWMLDRHITSIGTELKDDLGKWIQRRRKKGVEAQGRKAQKTLDACGVNLSTLREQWKLQQAAQLSLRAHAPARLKKELDIVLNLQGELDAVDKAIQLTRAALSKQATSKDSVTLLASLESTQQHLKQKVEALYASLNIEDIFPELQNIDLEFVRTLLMARDLKINIRKRAIGSFFEWDKLDQAAGGRDQAIGTKLHQTTRHAISKRKPALMSAIRKFNGYCAKLAQLYKSEWSIPLPEALPTQLAPLRECPHLMEDVWITPCPGTVPQWLEDADVREGIRAMLKVDRCHEELRRLGLESDNLCRWFGQELGALEVAIATPSNATYLVLLCQRRDHLLHLKNSYAGILQGNTRYEYYIQNAQNLARHMARTYTPSYKWITPFFLGNDTTGGEDTDATYESNNETQLQGVVPADDFVDSAEYCLDNDATLLADYLLSLEEPPKMELEEAPSALNHTSFIWSLPEPLICYGPDPFADLRVHTLMKPLYTDVPRVFYYAQKCFVFQVTDLAIMNDPRGRLNDICLNGIAKYLFVRLSHPTSSTFAHSTRCALFSTYDLLMARYMATDEEIWRRTHNYEYWLRDVWILPIHRNKPAEHWVLCTISLKTREILLYDSLADRNAWKHEIPEIVHLITRLLLVANQHGHSLQVINKEEWVARPVLIQRQQRNTYDCGLFVLANIIAALHGCHISSATQEDMGPFRDILFLHLLSLAPKM